MSRTFYVFLFGWALGMIAGAYLAGAGDVPMLGYIVGIIGVVLALVLHAAEDWWEGRP